MYSVLTPNGVLACEEGAKSSCFSSPPSSAFNRSIQMLLAYGEQLNLDYDLGDKLYQFCKELGCNNIHINLEQPVITNGSEKRLMELLLAEAAPKYIAHNITTQAETNEVIKEMVAWASCDDSYIGCCRLTQVWAN